MQPIFRAEMVEPAPAVIVVERHHQRLDRYALSLADAGYFLADFDHFGREFVAEDLRQRRTGEMMRMHRGDDWAGSVFMKVGAADAAHLRLDHDLLRSRTRRRGDLLDPDILLAVIANRFHVSLLRFLARSLNLTMHLSILPAPQAPERRRKVE